MENLQIQQSVAQAIACVHAPNTPPDVRANAGNFLEQYKQRPDSAQLSLGIFFGTTASQETTPLRHFSLHAVETSMKQQWYSWDGPTQETLKNAVVEIATNKLGDILSEPLAIREKVVSLLVELAKREWPQRWPTFLDVVLSLCRAGYTQADIGVRVLCRLAEDGTSPDFNSDLPVKRRHEILSALHSTCDQILHQLLHLLTSQYSTFVQSQRQNQRSLLLVDSTLQTLEYLCEWIPLEKIYKPTSTDVDMRRIFVTLMLDPGSTSTKIRAAQCLKCCVSRHKAFAPMIVNHIRPMIAIVNDACRRLDLGASMPSVLREDVLLQSSGSGGGGGGSGGGSGGGGGSSSSSSGVSGGAEIDESVYSFHKAVASLVSAMGVNLVAILDQPGNGSELNQYMDVAILLFSHPSLKMSADLIAAFSQLLVRNKAVLETAEAARLFLPLLNILAIKVRKWGSPNDHDMSGVLSEFSTFDYDDHEEFQIAGEKLLRILLSFCEFFI